VIVERSTARYSPEILVLRDLVRNKLNVLERRGIIRNSRQEYAMLLRSLSTRLRQSSGAGTQLAAHITA